jgi:hypothetical protein
MTRFLAGMTFAALLVLAAPAARAQGFVTGIDDVPLMPGLTTLKDAGMAFDDEVGRVVESYAYGVVSEAEVLAFYGETLPQLGWHAAPGRGVFDREGEVLRIEFLVGGPPLTIRFFLSPG